MPGLIAKKLGMTQVFDESGHAIPVTVVEAGPCTVVQVKTPERDGYRAVQLGFDPAPERKVNKPMAGHFTACGTLPFRHLFLLGQDRLDNRTLDLPAGGGELIEATIYLGVIRLRRRYQLGKLAGQLRLLAPQRLQLTRQLVVQQAEAMRAAPLVGKRRLDFRRSHVAMDRDRDDEA